VGSWCRGFDNLRFQTVPTLKSVWSNLVPYRIEFFVWLALRERIVTRDFLWRRNMLAEEDNLCPMCDERGESVHHILLHCSKARGCWDLVIQWLGTARCCPRTVGDLWGMWESLVPCRGEQMRGMWRVLFYAVVWSICLQRNNVIFQNGNHCTRHTVNISFSLWYRWLRSKDSTFPYSLGMMLLSSSWLLSRGNVGMQFWSYVCH